MRKYVEDFVGESFLSLIARTSSLDWSTTTIDANTCLFRHAWTGIVYRITTDCNGIITTVEKEGEHHD